MTKATTVDTRLSSQEARRIAVEAYVYLYPLMTMEVTRRRATNAAPGTLPGYGPMNTFAHIREFPPADFREVVRPNFDTLYSSGWLDLTEGPIVVSAPDTGGRYHLLPMLDMWTDVFAVPGSRTTGTGRGDFAVVPPEWAGRLPAGVERIGAPTPYAWLIGRIQTNGRADYPAVRTVQDGLRLTPLSGWGAPPSQRTPTEIDPTVDMRTPPLEQVNAMSGRDFFAAATELMEMHPPHLTDWPTLARMRRLGLTAGATLDPEVLGPVVTEALAVAPGAALQRMRDAMPRMAPVVNGWQMNISTMGVYGTDYLKRAIVAMVGLGANLPEDAVYPLLLADADGQPLTGGRDYVLHFDRAELPPVDAFWSLTMYDEQGYPVANPLGRFALGDRDPLGYNADGSLDLYVQHDSPGADKEANWLPAPRGPLGATLRLYAPRPEVLDGRWNPPPVRRASGQ